MPQFRVVETQVFEIEAPDAETAVFLVRDGVSHSEELVNACIGFWVSERDIEDEQGNDIYVEGA